MLKFASLIVLIIGTQLAGYESAMAGNAPPSTVPSANGGKTTELNYRSRLDSLITWFHEARIPSNYLAA
ncbi:MAG: hypothetical protein PF483_05710, partial [Halothiobacillus sp.]|nr:hypothetical protein [Halothiobacillus sp.]